MRTVRALVADRGQIDGKTQLRVRGTAAGRCKANKEQNIRPKFTIQQGKIDSNRLMV